MASLGGTFTGVTYDKRGILNGRSFIVPVARFGRPCLKTIAALKIELQRFCNGVPEIPGYARQQPDAHPIDNATSAPHETLSSTFRYWLYQPGGSSRSSASKDIFVGVALS
jgi:hypothetical protein